MIIKVAGVIHGLLAAVGLASLLQIAGLCCVAAAGEEPAAAQEQAVGAGVTFEALDDIGTSVRLRVEAVDTDPQDRDGDVRLYTLSQFDPAGDVWNSYCLPDAEGKSRAIPVRGSWRTDGSLDGAEDAVTFACTSGAIGKCIRFGYKPWKTVDGVSLRDHHQACMRMVRADYCGDGRPHTRDGTRIDMWDRLGIQVREQSTEHPEVFEAAWGPQGAEYVNVPRWSDDPRTLIGECPGKLEDRTSASRGSLAVEEVSKLFPEALIFNGRFVREGDRSAAPKPAAP
jgi:hypothetical protein